MTNSSTRPPARRTPRTVLSTNSPYAVKSGYYPKLEIANNLQRSISNLERIPLQQLRTFSRIIPVRKAFHKISNGVLAMPWTVRPPQELTKDEKALAWADELRKALLKPNRGEHNTYSKFVRALIAELLTLGFAAVERQPGKPSTQPFWLWVANGGHIHVNSEWSPDKEGLIPRFFDCSSDPVRQKLCTPLKNEELFIIQLETNSYELVPPSPLEIAFNLINSWLKVGQFQSNTTGQAVRDYILDLGPDTSQEDLDAFRQYWETDVLGKGKIPIVGGGKVNVVKLGAKNDEELYPKYTEYLLRLIGLAFDLSTRDYNITEPDNKATAGVAADATFSDAILPMAQCLEEHFNIEVIDFYEPGFFIEFIDSEPRGEKEESETATLLFEKNLITRNEGRLRVGEESLGPSGDVFADGASRANQEDRPESQQQVSDPDEEMIRQAEQAKTDEKNEDIPEPKNKPFKGKGFKAENSPPSSRSDRSKERRRIAARHQQ